MAWQFNSNAPVSKQIAERLRIDIVQNMYKMGSQFPTVRQLALEAAVNPNTVQKALSALEAEGLLEAKGTVGRFVTSDEETVKRTKEKIENEYISQVISDASALGISTERLFQLLKERNEKL